MATQPNAKGGAPAPKPDDQENVNEPSNMRPPSKPTPDQPPEPQEVKGKAQQPENEGE